MTSGQDDSIGNKRNRRQEARQEGVRKGSERRIAEFAWELSATNVASSS